MNIGRDLDIVNNRFNIIAETPGPRTFDMALSGAPQLMFDNTPAADWPAFFRDRRLAPSLARAARRGRPAATSLLEAVRRLRAARAAAGAFLKH